MMKNGGEILEAIRRLNLDRKRGQAAMKRSGIWMLTAALLTLGAFGAAWASTGGSYELSWFTVEGGGGESSQGRYALTGCVGQCDAGTSIGGRYKVYGGFLPVTAELDTAARPSWQLY
jgi:hypothetical protein